MHSSLRKYIFQEERGGRLGGGVALVDVQHELARAEARGAALRLAHERARDASRAAIDEECCDKLQAVVIFS